MPSLLYLAIEMREMDIVLSEELAYWMGVAQSDGCLTKYLVKRDKYMVKKEIISDFVSERYPLMIEN